MKKRFLASFLVCAAILLIGSQPVFAWNTWSDNGTGNCKTCHTATAIHAADGTSHTTCANCHVGTPAAGTVSPSACIVCHPVGDVGLCPLIDAQALHGSTCLSCHTDCAASTTTTTISEPGCLTFTPDSVEVDGADNVTLDVTVTLTNPGIPPMDTGGTLVAVINSSCAQYITVNSATEPVIDNDTATATVNITVQGNAPSSQCSISATYSSAAVDPPVSCEATFTITQTGLCSVVSIEPGLGFLPLTSRFFPVPRRIIITGENSNWNRTSAVSIEDVRLVIPLRVDPTIIRALILIPSKLLGFEPGTKTVSVATGGEICEGTVDIE